MERTLVEQLSIFKQGFDVEMLSFFERKLLTYQRVDGRLVEVVSRLKAQVMRGGKRFRPFIGMSAYRLAGGDEPDKALQLLVAVELVHQFLLIHDDIADNDEQRYGSPSYHEAIVDELTSSYGISDRHRAQAIALGAGDQLHSMSIDAVCESGLSNKKKVEIISWINSYLAATVAGWTEQFYALGKPIGEVSEADYLSFTRMVAAHYTVEGPMIVGLLMADNEVIRPTVSKYALAAGMAFQIQDDVLGLLGDVKKMGKPVGNDFREGKKSLLIIKAYQLASPKEKAWLDRTIGTEFSIKQLNHLQAILYDTGAVDYVTDLAQSYAVQAKNALDELPATVNADELATLKSFADYMISREY